MTMMKEMKMSNLNILVTNLDGFSLRRNKVKMDY